MEVILDTNTLSAAAGGDPEITERIKAARRRLIPVIVLGEYRFGIFQSQRRKIHEEWLNMLLTGSVVLEITDATTFHYAEIRGELKRAGTPIPSNDLWIAALCRQHQAILLSRDRHFDRVAGLTRLP